MNSVKATKWLTELNICDKNPFEYNSVTKKFWCKPCEKAISADQKSQLKQHRESEKHRSNSSLKRKLVQPQLSFNDPKKVCTREEKIGQDLCTALLAANIPIQKVEVPKFREFLEENIGFVMPSVNTIRQKYVPKVYENAFESIKKDLEGKNIWMSIDETTDKVGRKVANVIIGELNSEKYCKPYLAKCTFLEAADHGTIARLANDTLKELWPSFECNLLKIFVSDAAPYMVKAGKALEIFYPSMIHMTCLCHALHRVCEQIREMYPIVNSVISACKKVFLKSPSRIQAFKESYPNVPLPPEPILTR